MCVVQSSRPVHTVLPPPPRQTLYVLIPPLDVLILRLPGSSSVVLCMYIYIVHSVYYILYSRNKPSSHARRRLRQRRYRLRLKYRKCFKRLSSFCRPNRVFLSIWLLLLLLYDVICSECEYECKLPTLCMCVS